MSNDEKQRESANDAAVPEPDAPGIEADQPRAPEGPVPSEEAPQPPEPSPREAQGKEEVRKLHLQPALDPELQRELDEALGGASLEDLLDAEAAAQRGGAEEIRSGKVVAIHGDDIFVDLGGRSEGVLTADQFREEGPPAVGDVIEVVIEGYDENDGLLMLSRQGAVQAATWETLEEGAIVEGRVTGHNKGGLELTINGIRAFMPISQIDILRVEDLAPYVNQKFQCEVVELDRREENVVVSRRAVLERQAAQRREELFGSLAEGQVVPGVVRSIMPYGAFVDIGGVDGLLHIADMSHGRIEDPSQIVAEGQQLEVKVLKINREERRISLGLKQILPDPWDGAETKWPADEVVTGRVTRLMDFGAFVELEAGVEGLIPISEFTFERRIAHPREMISEGDTVKVRVMSLDLERKRISLSLKRVGDDPWMGASVRWPAESVVSGRVTRLADFGAFVELTPGVEGLIHISELSNARVRSVADVVREGSTVQAKVLSVDEDNRRISLSIKQLASMPEYTGPARDESEPAKPTGKRKRPLKGGLD